MIFKELPLSGAFLIDIEKKDDDRGFFARSFCAQEFQEQGLNLNWNQVNCSFTKAAGTLRGLHFQYPPHAEVKVVRCIRGSIWDVIVDIRPSSKTYSKWFGAELNEDNRTMMYVPKGFAHGFVTLKDNSEVIYFVSDAYSQLHEAGLLWNDQKVGIAWPILPLLVSEKDQKNLQLNELKPIAL